MGKRDRAADFMIHQDLIDHYRGYQGCEPKKADYLFLSKDANFPPKKKLARKLWECLCQYLQRNDVGEWERSLQGRGLKPRKKWCHHPSTLKIWHGHWSAAAFHRTVFQLLDETRVPGIYERCSFIELLCVPTVGNSSRDARTLQKLFWGKNTTLVQDRKFAHLQERQVAHRRNLESWIRECRGIAILARPVFDFLYDYSCDCDIFGDILKHEPDVRRAFSKGLRFESPQQVPGPSFLVAKWFPYYRGQEKGVKKQDIAELAKIIKKNEERRNA